MSHRAHGGKLTLPSHVAFLMTFGYELTDLLGLIYALYMLQLVPLQQALVVQKTQ